MSKYYLIIKLFFTTLSVILLTACGGVSSTSSNTFYTTTSEVIELGIDNPVCQKGSSNYTGKVKDRNTGKAIKGVDVIIDGCSTRTDKNGYYKLSNISSKSRTPVTFKKDGYYKNSEIIYNNKNTSNHLEFSFDAYKSWEELNFNSKSGTSRKNIEVSDTTTYINVKTYQEYIGAIKVNLLYKNIYNNEKYLPGNYQGIDSNNNIVAFESYGFISLEIKDSNNSDLKISKPITVKIGNVKGIKDEIIPLWYYNFDKGIWIEKGFAEKDENGNYICELSHSGAWSLSKAIETDMGTYKGYIVDVNGEPIKNVRVNAIGKNWITKDLTTDENGLFELHVVPNKSFSIYAYDYKERYGAEFMGYIAPIKSGEIVEE